MSIVDLDDRRRQPADLPAADLQAAARAEAEAQAAAGNPLTGVELGSRFGRSERWGRDRLAELGGSRQPADRAATRRPQPVPATGNGNTGGGNGSTQRQPPAALPATGGRQSPTAAAGNGTSGSRQPATPAAAGSRQRARVPAAAMQPADVPRSLVAVTVAAVAIVAVVTMITSYSHTYDLAVLAGQARVAKFLPAAVDGLVIAGSTSLLVDHHLRRPGSTLARAAVVLGLVSSMAANVVAVDPTLVDLRVVKWVMAAYAPLALAVSGHLLLRMLGQDQKAT